MFFHFLADLPTLGFCSIPKFKEDELSLFGEIASPILVPYQPDAVDGLNEQSMLLSVKESPRLDFTEIKELSKSIFKFSSWFLIMPVVIIPPFIMVYIF